MRELMLGPKRFSDIRADLPGISANVLTQRLEGLRQAGWSSAAGCRRPPSTQVYELTPGAMRPSRSSRSSGAGRRARRATIPSLPLSAASLMLSFRTMFDPARAAGLDFSSASGSAASASPAGSPTGARGRARRSRRRRPGVRGRADRDRGRGLWRRAARRARSGRRADVEGDRALAERFVTLFPLPAKVGQAADRAAARVAARHPSLY